ncbi:MULTISPECIES: DUF928 domain-containing protein [Calothrix]|uniref:DUF928 domain-containing protein n=2 Tax=Calothrix TaxID=1186 RepID=A0ABR8AK60_9CYAN|nr:MULTISPECIES: DUF928 domain-containing protein [Calothrix]MBD2200368.1 DUF928 domain-containing protein [Calothrix parietina FACHB-288]MBD2229347.1 DUF928 domain-containing protein [Calothrix anomala FACHB-343]
MIELKSKLWRQLITICTITTVFSGSLLSVISLSSTVARADINSEASPSGRQNGGGKRSQCSELENDNLMALVPKNNEILTTKEYPDFWFNLPFAKSSQSLPATFRLLNEEKKSVLSKPLKLSLPEKKGIAKLSLPSTEKPLVVGQRYHWYFSITCVNDQGSPSNIFVDGWIKRVEPDSTLVERLKQTKPQDKYFPYFENNIWAEAISELAEYRNLHPQEWVKILSQYSLEKAASEPISELKP